MVSFLMSSIYYSFLCWRTDNTVTLVTLLSCCPPLIESLLNLITGSSWAQWDSFTELPTINDSLTLRSTLLKALMITQAHRILIDELFYLLCCCCCYCGLKFWNSWVQLTAFHMTSQPSLPLHKAMICRIFQRVFILTGKDILRYAC